MEFNPFFEPDKMSDEELGNKLIDLRRRLMIAHYSQSSLPLMQALQAMIQSIEVEQDTRFQIQTQRAWDKMFPDVIESDPEAKEKRQEQTQKSDKTGPRKRVATDEIFQKEYLNQPLKKNPDEK